VWAKIKLRNENAQQNLKMLPGNWYHLRLPFQMSLTARPCGEGGLIDIYPLVHSCEAEMFV